jgi:ubiquinone/menaquinone biosynthesis C-methylase UbiE
VDGIMAAANLFHSARVSMLIRPGERVLDLGCGPGTQLVQIAELNPAVRFIGVDLSDNMLADARRYSQGRGVANVEWRHGDVCDLAEVTDWSVDAVISTMTLHHLPTEEHLGRCFREIARVLKPDGAVYLADFGRLKRPDSVGFFANMHADTLPREVCVDYENSLKAAFAPEDFKRAAGFVPAATDVITTFIVPLLMIVKTRGDRTPPPDLRARLREMRARLSPPYRRELDDLRTFFRLSGLRLDPFAGT